MSHHLTTLEDRIPGVREVVWLDDSASPEGMLRFEDLANYEAADDVGAANDDSPASSIPAARPAAPRASCSPIQTW